MTAQTVERKEMLFFSVGFPKLFCPQSCCLLPAKRRVSGLHQKVYDSSCWIMNGRNLSSQHYSYEKGNPALKLEDLTAFIGKDTIWSFCYGTFIHIRWMRPKNSLTGAKQTKFIIRLFSWCIDMHCKNDFELVFNLFFDLQNTFPVALIVS